MQIIEVAQSQCASGLILKIEGKNEYGKEI
jgi:hypothetical protein